MALEGRVENTRDLSTKEKDRMYAVLDAHFLRVTRESFERDLAEKTWVILVEDPERHELVGFSTMMAMDGSIEDRPFQAIFSGDTIIDRRYWGETVLGRFWIHFLTRKADEARGRDTWWFLTTMGHRTYRVLPLFFREYYPREAGPIPPWEKKLLDYLGRVKFGDCYDARRGIIHFDPPREHLRPELREESDSQRGHAAIRFFEQKNPGFHEGDELACLARVHPDNLSRFARKLLARETPV